MSRPSDPNAKVNLLCAAEAVFMEHGLEKARIEDITARAGRSKGSFYLHFATKEEAFRQIVETLLARLATCVAEPLPGLTRNGGKAFEPRAFLESAFEKDLEVFEILWQHRRVARLLLSGGGSADFGYLIDEFAERARTRMKDLLVWGTAVGMFRPGLDPDVVSLYIAGAYDRVARHLVRLDKKPDLSSWLRTMQAVVFAGIGTAAAVHILDPAVKNRPSSKPPRNTPAVKMSIRTDPRSRVSSPAKRASSYRSKAKP